MNPIALLLVLPLAAQDGEGAPRERRIGIYERTLPDEACPRAVLFDASNAALVTLEGDSGQVWERKLDGSATPTRKYESEQFRLSDPHAFARTGERLFVSDSGNHRIVVLGADPRSIGGYGAAPGEFRDPRGIAATTDALYVVDSGNDRVQKLAPDGTPLEQVGRRGTGEGEFLRPLDVAVDDQGFVYVTDSGNHRVQKFDLHLRFVKSWGDFGPHPGFFASPDGIAFFEDELYVVDTDNHRVQVFDTDGNVEYEWGLHALLPREGEGKLHYPSGITLFRDPSHGALAAVTEPQENRVQLFRSVGPTEDIPQNAPGTRVVSAHYGPNISVAGDLLALSEPGAPALLVYDTEHEVEPWEPILITRTAMWGRKAGQLLAPNDIAIDWRRKLLYVADVDLLRVSCYAIAHDEARELAFDFFLLKFVRGIDFGELHRLGRDEAEFAIRPDAIELAPDGDLWVVDSLQRTVFALTPEFTLCSWDATTRGRRPIDLAFSPDGRRCYVLDELDGTVEWLDVPTLRLERWQLGLQPAGRFGARGTAAGKFVRPGGIAVAPDGNVFVSDAALQRVQVFDADGRHRATFGNAGLGRVEFHRPRGLDVDAAGRLWIVDWGNHRGQVLAPDGSFLVAFGSRPFVRPTLGPR